MTNYEVSQYRNDIFLNIFLHLFCKRNGCNCWSIIDDFMSNSVAICSILYSNHFCLVFDIVGGTVVLVLSFGLSFKDWNFEERKINLLSKATFFKTKEILKFVRGIFQQILGEKYTLSSFWKLSLFSGFVKPSVCSYNNIFIIFFCYKTRFLNYDLLTWY